MRIKNKYCIGIDYGTDSVRGLLVEAESGLEIASSVFEYPRWKQGLYCDPSIQRFRQHPLDYIEGIEFTVRELVKHLNGPVDQILSISIATTGSTPVAVDKSGIPLSLLPEFYEEPDAMFILWKDHTAKNEADRINMLCQSWKINYSKYSGGTYSAEWFWSKINHVINENPDVALKAYSWVEHCDWMPALLTGKVNPSQLRRSRCAAGHKAMWHNDWDGLPSDEFLTKLSPKLKGLRDRLYAETYTSDNFAGNLSPEWAIRLGLKETVKVGVGGLDAHFGAVGGEIGPFFLCKVIGTSTCDMLIAPVQEYRSRCVSGISGQVEGSIIPGMVGMEAGQSAFGDIYSWFRNLVTWPLSETLNLPDEVSEQVRSSVISDLSRYAAKIPCGSSGILAIDWLNGRRTPDANPHLRGAIIGLTLGSDAPRLFKALVESTAFGSRMILERFIDQSIQIKGIIALGGIARKSPFIMQVLADVLKMPIKVVKSEHTCALGAAMFASVIAGIHRSVHAAQEKMGKGFDCVYYPDHVNSVKYDSMYLDYCSLGSYMENVHRS